MRSTPPHHQYTNLYTSNTTSAPTPPPPPPPPPPPRLPPVGISRVHFSISLIDGAINTTMRN